MKIDQDFIKKYQNMIRNVIWKTGVRDREEHDALFNDVVIRIIEHGNYDPEKGGVTNWLYLVTRSVIGNHLKKKTRDATFNSRPLNDELIPAIGQEQDPAEKESLLSIIAKVYELSKAERKLLINHYHLGRTYGEIAKRDGENFEQVKKRCLRAKEKLITQVQGELNVEEES